MKCPKCESHNTRKVWVHEPNWHVGHQICLDCKHQDDWLLFCEPPIVIKSVIDDLGDSND